MSNQKKEAEVPDEAPKVGSEKQSVQPEKAKTAFFITPLGSDNSDIRRATDGLIDAVIEPVLGLHKISLIPPHKIKNPGTITRQIVRHILESDLVIANLTGLNANVMYELAIRHAKRKPIIIIAEKGTILPFDIAAERTIFYTNDMGGTVELKNRLDETIPLALIDEYPENPIYNGLESAIIQEKVQQEDNPVQAYLLEKIDLLTDSMAALQNNLLSRGSYKEYISDVSKVAFSEILLVLKNGSTAKYKRLGDYIVSFLPVASSRITNNGLYVTLPSSTSAGQIKDLFYRFVNNGYDLEMIDTPSFTYRGE